MSISESMRYHLGPSEEEDCQDATRITRCNQEDAYSCFII